MGVDLCESGDYESGSAVVAPPKPNWSTSNGCALRNAPRKTGGAVIPARAPHEVRTEYFASQLESVVSRKSQEGTLSPEASRCLSNANRFVCSLCWIQRIPHEIT